MNKLCYEQKKSLYNDWKLGLSINSLSIKYNISKNRVQYLCCLIDKHGEKVKKQNNKKYSIYIKKKAINRVLVNNEAIWAVSLEMGLSSCGILAIWIKKHKETKDEKIKRLEEGNLYLKALDRKIRKENENPNVGVILCSSKDKDI